MQKKDLKDLMIVRFRMDERKLHLKVNNLLFNLDGYMTLDNYNEDLTHPRRSEYDIMEVYTFDSEIHFESMADFLQLHNRILVSQLNTTPLPKNDKLNKIWERK